LPTGFAVLFVLAACAPAWAQDSQSLGDLARAAQSKPSAETNLNSMRPRHPSIAASSLVAWHIAGMPVPDVLDELQRRGIAFVPDDAHLNTLKDAHLAPEILAALPDTPSHPDYSDSWGVPQTLIEASLAFDAKTYAAARSSLEILVHDDANADLYAALGNVDFVSGDLSAAEASFRKAEQLDFQLVYVHVRLAALYYRLEKASEMTIEAGAALQLEPGNAQARKYLALSAVMGSHASGASSAPSAESRGEDTSDLKSGTNQEGKELNKKGIALARQQAYPEAEDDYRRAIELDPEIAAYYYNLGNLYWKEYGSSGADKWEPVFRHAMTLAPRNLSVRQNLGHALCQSGRYSEAVTVFREMLSIDPTWNMARPCLYHSLLNLGLKDEAAQVNKDYWRYGGDRTGH
jgi:tetratricopeptide (TPR) repeat protein